MSDNGASDNNGSDSGDDDGGLFGSIGFMFDTAQEKISKDFQMIMDVPDCIHEEEDTDTNTNTPTSMQKNKEMEVNISLYIIDDDPGHVISGQYLWPSAYSLSRYLMLHWYEDILPYFTSDATSTSSLNSNSPLPVVVELGSGVGMCGQFLSKFFLDIEKKRKTRSEEARLTSSSSTVTTRSTITSPMVILTDYDPGCLEMLADNIELNQLQTCCQVARVEWGKTLTNVFEIAHHNNNKYNNNSNDSSSNSEAHDEESNYDNSTRTRSQLQLQLKLQFLVIGSDLLYCVSVVRPLFSTVCSMLMPSYQSSSSSSSSSTTASCSADEDCNEEDRGRGMRECDGNIATDTDTEGANMDMKDGLSSSPSGGGPGPGPGLFILASSFDIGEDVQCEVDNCCIEFGIKQVEVQALDLSGDEKQYRIQYFSKISS